MRFLLKSILITSMFSFIGLSLTVTAQENTIEGVVVSKSRVKNTITVKSDVSGKRHTYFLGDTTRLMSQGKPMRFIDIKRGQKVSLAFRQTDSGRELQTFRVPNPEDILEIIPVEIDEVLTISGVVTGVRPIKRTISIRSEDYSERLTLHVPEGTKITRNGEAVSLRKLAKGDNAAFKYHITEEGYVIVSGKSPKAKAASAVVDSSANSVPMLPKTASNLFIWLFAGLGLFLAAGLVNLVRRRSVI